MSDRSTFWPTPPDWTTARIEMPGVTVTASQGDRGVFLLSGPGKAISEIVYRMVGKFGGTISAEHGIGLVKKPYLPLSRTPAELALMRRLKRALDPQDMLNPGKVFDMEDGA